MAKVVWGRVKRMDKTVLLLRMVHACNRRHQEAQEKGVTGNENGNIVIRAERLDAIHLSTYGKCETLLEG